MANFKWDRLQVVPESMDGTFHVVASATGPDGTWDRSAVVATIHRFMPTHENEKEYFMLVVPFDVTPAETYSTMKKALNRVSDFSKHIDALLSKVPYVDSQGEITG
jgi:hypothetical protein